MRRLFVLLAEHAISRLRGSAAWEDIAASAGIPLPLDGSESLPGDVVADVADRLATAMSTDRSTALRAIGEHSFPLVVDSVPSVFEIDTDLPPGRHADRIFQNLHQVIEALLEDTPASVVPPMTWTREGRRRELTARTDNDTADVLEGQVIALLEWLDLDARMERHELGDGLVRFEMWWD